MAQNTIEEWLDKLDKEQKQYTQFYTMKSGEQADIEILDIEERLFTMKDGKQRKHFKGPWHRIREAAGLPRDFRFHGLRHHFASTLVSNGIDLAIVKELLTHKDIATTQRYAHLKPDAVHDAAKRSASLLTPEKEDVIISKRG